MSLPDDFSKYYENLLDGSYDCLDRLVLRAYCPILQSAGGFRCWWEGFRGSHDDLDDNHLMRMAGRFSRRVRAWTTQNDIPLIYCKRGERKHEMAEAQIPADPDFLGVFLVQVSKLSAPVYKVKRYASGRFHLTRQYAFINHYSFHIMDPEWGHVTVIIAGHPPFNALVVLNGHEWVERAGREEGLQVGKTGNCFTEISDAALLNRTADALSDDVRTVGRLVQVCERWLYSACLCFGLTREEQERSGFRYQYAVYQAEYSRNLLFRRGSELDEVFEGFIDRTRRDLDLRKVTTIFGWKYRPKAVKKRGRKNRPRFEVTVETLEYNLTVFKVHFGDLTLKAYSKGERVLRIEAIVHNAKVFPCGTGLDRFPQIVQSLRDNLIRFLNALRHADKAFLDDGMLDELPQPTLRGDKRLAGVDINQPRMRSVVQALTALAPDPAGFTIGDLAEKVRAQTGQPESDYGPRQAAYDLRKLRGKDLVERIENRRRYRVLLPRFQALAGLVIVRQKIFIPLVASAGDLRKAEPRSKKPGVIDQHYRALQRELRRTFAALGLVA